MSQPPPPHAAAPKPLDDEPVEGVPMAPSAGDTYNYHYHGTVNNVTNNYAGSAPATADASASAAASTSPPPAAPHADKTAPPAGASSVAMARLRARRGTSLAGSAERIGESLRRRRESVSSSDGGDSDGSVTPPEAEHSWQMLVKWPDGWPTHLLVLPDAPLCRSVSPSLLWKGKRHLLYDGERVSLDKTPRENGLQNGAILQLCRSQRGGGPGDATADAYNVPMAEASESDDGGSDADMDAELQYEAAIRAEQEQEQAPAPGAEPAGGGAAPQGVQLQPQPAAAAAPVLHQLQLPAGASGRHVVVPNARFMRRRGVAVGAPTPGW